MSQIVCILFVKLFSLYLIVPLYLRKQYPLVRDNIQGEESATFTNGLGDSADLAISDDEANTVECLVKILNGDRIAAEVLAAEVHRTVVCENADLETLPDLVI